MIIKYKKYIIITIFIIILLTLFLLLKYLFNKINNKQITKIYKHKYNVYKIYIITTKSINSIAYNLYKYLQELNVETIIKYDLSEEECDTLTNNELYIFIHISMIKHNKIPKLFVVYQVEQTQSNWFNDKYYRYLENATYIWEFSIKNKYLYNYIDQNKIFYQMIPYYLENKSDNKEISYDIFFYGAKNIRRQRILECLKSFNLKIGYDIYDNERDDMINKSKIILNLHYYNDCSLETCRLNEILKYNKVIISEKASADDWYNEEIYKDFVDYIDIIDNELSNVNNLIKRIIYYLDENNYNKKIDNIKNKKYILHDKSKFNLYKNLFNIFNCNNYLFDYELYQNKIYCLHLIETPERINKFKKINNITSSSNIEIFPAFKYNPGWKGCALSYLNLIYNAKRCNLENITICEDDCRFPYELKEIYNIIKEFLSKIEWNIFVGVIADLPTDVKIINIYQYKNIKFIELNKMNSMVFNIYNKNSYDNILKWNINNNDVHTNTIDKFLNTTNLTFITTYPFYFDCINVNSTLWGKNLNLFSEYNNMFKKSLNILDDKIRNFSHNIRYIK